MVKCRITGIFCYEIFVKNGARRKNNCLILLEFDLLLWAATVFLALEVCDFTSVPLLAADYIFDIRPPLYNTHWIY